MPGRRKRMRNEDLYDVELYKSLFSDDKPKFRGGEDEARRL